MMNEVLKRIRKVFEDSGKSQTEIGKTISKTPQYVWKLLNNDNTNPGESVIKDICREFDINENWLRSGEGKMKEDIIPEDEYFKAATQIAKSKDELAMQAVVEYWKLDENSKQVFKDFIYNIAKKSRD